MTTQFAFTIKTQRFNEDYTPALTTRLTTNFANLARGANRQQNLRNALQMIDKRFNDLASWDNPEADRYRVLLDIVSVEMAIQDSPSAFPAIEIELCPKVGDGLKRAAYHGGVEAPSIS